MRLPKKILRTAAAVTAASSVMCFAAFAVSASEASLEFTPAASDGDRIYAVHYDTALLGSGKFDPRTMTPDSQVKVSFTCKDPRDDVCPVELIWQSWGNHTEKVNNWSVVSAAEYGSGYAVFNYSDIAAAYGSEDFSQVYTVIVRDTGRSVTVNNVTVTNLNIPGEENITVTEPAGTEETAEAGSEEASSVEISHMETDQEETEVLSESGSVPAETRSTESPAAGQPVSETETSAADADDEKAPGQKAVPLNTKVIIIIAAAAVSAAVIAAVLIKSKKKRKGNRFY